MRAPVLARPLVIGASGLVGGAFHDRLSALGITVAGTFHSRPRPGLVPFHLGEDSSRFLERLDPSLVILASAVTHVDWCEANPAETINFNVERLRPIAEWCAQRGIALVFFSTDYVFDGANGPYGEDDPRRPINVYGRSKSLGEDIVGVLPRGAIVRITNVFDIGRDEKNFLHRCVTTLRERRELVVPIDQFATPTYAPWLAEEVVALISRGTLCGSDSVTVLNVACDDLVSRADFAKRVATRLGADAGLVRGRTTTELNQRAARPLRGGLRNAKLKGLLGVDRLALDDALDDSIPRMRSLYGTEP